MDQRVFRRVQRYGWDAATDRYASSWAALLAPHGEACVARAEVRIGEAVLDVGTGPGVAALAAAARTGPRGRVVGIDLSENMVAEAQRRARGTGLDHMLFERRDMQETAQADGAFDVVLAAFSLMFAPDRTATLKELARVLRPGGRLSACVWGHRARCAWAAVFPIAEAHVASDVCPLFFALGVPGAPRAALERAGFCDVVEERAEITLRWSSGEEAVRDAFEGGAVALAWTRFSPAVKASAAAAYLDAIAPYRRGDAYELPAEVVHVVAKRSPVEGTP